MVTRLSDVVVPEVYGPYMRLNTKVEARFFQSGAVSSNALIASKLASGGGEMFNVPYWGDLANTPMTPGSDNPADKLSLGKIQAFKQVVRRVVGTAGWGSMKLQDLLSGDNAQMRIQERVAAYWNRQFQAWLNATLTGIRESNIANNGGDMILDIAIPASDPIANQPTVANLISPEALINASLTMGDARNDIVMIVAHSVIVAALEKLDLVRTVMSEKAASETDISLNTNRARKYFGKWEILEDDFTTMEVTPAGGGNPARVRYVTTLLAKGSIAFDENPGALIPAAIDRDELSGNGTGEEWLVTRRNFAMTPAGFSWLETNVAGEFPSIVEVADGDNWRRVFPERKQVPFAFLITNG